MKTVLEGVPHSLKSRVIYFYAQRLLQESEGRLKFHEVHEVAIHIEAVNESQVNLVVEAWTTLDEDYHQEIHDMIFTPLYADLEEVADQYIEDIIVIVHPAELV